MSHVDDGTLHTYLDGELAPAEARGVDAHFAQCPACRERLEQERALITRAGELLALAAPPDREVPPWRPGDAKPLERLWWQVRLPLAWAATIVLALGIGTYLGREGKPVPRAQTVSDTQPASTRALEAPIRPELAQRESRVKERGRTPVEAHRLVQPQPETVAPRADSAAPLVAYAERAAEPQARVAQQKAPQDGPDLWQRGSAINLDSARRVLGADPLVVAGVPIEAIYRGRHIGYSGVVIVEQVLDSSTMIEVINARSAPVALSEVVVTGAGAVAAGRDSATVAERAPLGRARIADSLAATPRDAERQRVSEKVADRPGAHLFSDVRGPLSADSLAALRRLLRPLRP